MIAFLVRLGVPNAANTALAAEQSHSGGRHRGHRHVGNSNADRGAARDDGHDRPAGDV